MTALDMTNNRLTYQSAECAQVFKEYCEECEDLSKLVQRDPALQDNALLPGGWVGGCEGWMDVEN